MITSSFTLKESLQSQCHLTTVLEKQTIHLSYCKIPLKITFRIPLLQNSTLVDGKIYSTILRKRNGEMTVKMMRSVLETYYRHLKYSHKNDRQGLKQRLRDYPGYEVKWQCDVSVTRIGDTLFYSFLQTVSITPCLHDNGSATY